MSKRARQPAIECLRLGGQAVAACLAVTVALAVVLAVAPVRAGPPLLTDDPDTPGPGGWEINLASELEKSGEEWAFAAPLLDLNYGWGEDIQLKFEMPWLVLDAPGRDARSGAGNAELGVKWRFLDEEDIGFSLSTYPQAEFHTSSSARRRGLVDDGAEFLLPVEVAKSFGPLLLYAEAGHAWREHRENEWIYGFAAEYELTSTIDLVAEVHGIAAAESDAHELFLNGGFKWHFHDHLALLAAAGHSVHTPIGEPGIALGYLGVQLAF